MSLSGDVGDASELIVLGGQTLLALGLLYIIIKTYSTISSAFPVFGAFIRELIGAAFVVILLLFFVGVVVRSLAEAINW